MSSEHKQHTKLGQFYATAICGNDILSSSLYVSGIAVLFSGIFAPLVLLFVGIVLLLYRQVYREVGEALPINGGAYNALLNSTSKISASVAGTMTILSYIATAVISAKTAVEYFIYFLGVLFSQIGVPYSAEQLRVFVIPSTLCVLLAFALLVIWGVKDSAKVAAAIFTFHIVTLTVFIVVGIVLVATQMGAGTIVENWQTTIQMILHANHPGMSDFNGLMQILFFGFAVSLLGVSGFESSANFIEEQAPGVFAKTLRNMTAGVVIFNPLIAAVTLAVLPIATIIAQKDFVLGAAGNSMGGIWLLGLIGIDAFLVLCGAVLTAYVGVSGLANRMSLDNVLPSFLSRKNSRGSYPRIVLVFLGLCASILILTKGNLLSLAGVYTISFLSVMTLFAVGNLILRMARPELKRPYRASTAVVILAAFSTMVGLMGNIQADTNNVVYFLIYFLPAMAIVFAMLFQKDFYSFMVEVFRIVPIRPIRSFFERQFDIAADIEYYVFIHHTSNLFRALEYIHNNEGGHSVTLIHCKGSDEGEREDMESAVPVLTKAGVFDHMDTIFIYLDKEFGPETVASFVKDKNISPSHVFIGSIHESHDFSYQDFGGVRIILE